MTPQTATSSFPFRWPARLLAETKRQRLTRLNWLAFAQRCRGAIAPSSLAVVLGMSGAVWLAQVAIAPPIAMAYTDRVSITLDWTEGESYATLLRRAETAARAATQRSFDADLLVTDVDVTIVGESQGNIVPILGLRVSRSEWRSRPDPQYWLTYYRTAPALLELGRPVASP